MSRKSNHDRIYAEFPGLDRLVADCLHNMQPRIGRFPYVQPTQIHMRVARADADLAWRRGRNYGWADTSAWFDTSLSEDGLMKVGERCYALFGGDVGDYLGWPDTQIGISFAYNPFVRDAFLPHNARDPRQHFTWDDHNVGVLVWVTMREIYAQPQRGSNATFGDYRSRRLDVTIYRSPRDHGWAELARGAKLEDVPMSPLRLRDGVLDQTPDWLGINDALGSLGYDLFSRIHHAGLAELVQGKPGVLFSGNFGGVTILANPGVGIQVDRSEDWFSISCGDGSGSFRVEGFGGTVRQLREIVTTACSYWEASSPALRSSLLREWRQQPS